MLLANSFPLIDENPNRDSAIMAHMYEFNNIPENTLPIIFSDGSDDDWCFMSIAPLSNTLIEIHQNNRKEHLSNQEVNKIKQDLHVVFKVISRSHDFFNYVSLKQDQEYSSLYIMNADPDPPCIPKVLMPLSAFDNFHRNENYILPEPLRISKFHNIWKEPDLFRLVSNSSFGSVRNLHTDSPFDGFETAILFSIFACAGQYFIIESPTPKSRVYSPFTKYLQCSRCQTRLQLSKLPLAQLHNLITITAEILVKLLNFHDVTCPTRQTVGRLAIDDTVGYAVEEERAASLANAKPNPNIDSVDIAIPNKSEGIQHCNTILFANRVTNFVLDKNSDE